MPVEQLVSRFLEEAVSRIVRRASEGKKLSDREVTMLFMSLMMRRFDDLRGYVDKRFDDLKVYIDGRFSAVEKRIDSLEGRINVLENRLNVVHSEVSSIKTDIIKMMREFLERAYGGKESLNFK
jgi:hypothetical protein